MENTSTKHISKLDVDQPSGSAPISEADDHLRFIKDCIKQTFSGITAVGSGNVTAASSDLNKLDGYTGTTGDLNTIAGAVSSGLTTSDIAKLAGVSVSAAELNRVTGLSSDISTLLSAKAPLASPAFTNTPTAPTQATDDNSTKIATTAYVTAKTSGIPTSANLAATNAAVALNTAYRATSTAAIGGKANSASPTISNANLTGTPTAPTAGVNANNTTIATTAFVQGLITSAIATAVTTAASNIYPVNSIFITTANYSEANNGSALASALGLAAGAKFVRYAEGRTIVGFDTGYNVTAISSTNNIATLTIGSHSYDVGDQISVSGITNSSNNFNGTYIITAAGGTTIRYNALNTGTVGTTNVSGGAVKGTAFDTINETGGSSNTLQAESEVANHRHHVISGAAVGESGSVIENNYIAASASQSGSTNQSYALRPTGSEANRGLSSDETVNSSGNDVTQTAMNNLQPYIVTYMWRRTA